MNKFWFLVFGMLWTPLQISAQSLPVNEEGKIVFWEVVKTDSFQVGHLYTNVKNWLKNSNYQLISEDSLGGKLLAKQLFVVYDRGYVSKKLHGKIAYRLIIELKDHKYRYQFTDFVFHYYKEDRTYRFTATGKQKKLEEPIAKGWQSLWDSHKKTTFAIIQKQIDLLKAAMLLIPKSEQAVIAKPISEDW